MNNKKHANNKMKNILICIILILLALIVTLGLSLASKSEANDSVKYVNNITKENIEIKAFEIETDYGKLYYPKNWKENVKVEFSNEFGNKVEFYGLVKDDKTKHIFDICFNSDDGLLLGYLEIEDQIINISVDVMELEFDDSWTQEEMDKIYSMQEEMNFVIDALNINDNYVQPE